MSRCTSVIGLLSKWFFFCKYDFHKLIFQHLCRPRRNVDGELQTRLEEDGNSNSRQSWMKTSAPPGTSRHTSSNSSLKDVACWVNMPVKWQHHKTSSTYCCCYNSQCSSLICSACAVARWTRGVSCVSGWWQSPMQTRRVKRYCRCSIGSKMTTTPGLRRLVFQLLACIDRAALLLLRVVSLFASMTLR